MESTSFLIYEKIKSGESLTQHEIMVYFILIPLIGIVMTQIKDIGLIIFDYSKNLIKFKSNTLSLSGREVMLNNCMCFEYPESMLALNHWFQQNKKLSNFRAFNVNRNGDYYYEDIKNSIKSESCAYIAEECKKTKVENDLYLTVKVEKINIEGKKETIVGTQTVMILSSKKRNLNTYVEKLLGEYQKYIENKNKDKLFHFIYQGEKKFSKTIISEKPNPSYETFDNIINEHTAQFKRDIRRLKDLDYYRRTGLKRKKGYLFYGHPGCGKTASVMAMAIHDNRHILEIPISRVQKNKEIEDILNLTKIEGVSFNKNEIIILFDEIDCGGAALKEREKLPEDGKEDLQFPGFMKTLMATTVENNGSDKLNLGMMLSRLDGIGNYNGLIIIATTNHKEKLDPAMYRELRLSPIFFDYSRKEDIIDMIEMFYNTTLNPKDKLKIPDRNACITPAKVRWFLEKYEDSLEDLLTYLAKIAN
jgi:ATP-dependent 26S proteasome regulatory subunit